MWREEPPTLGVPHNGFFYPDPLGFWTEVRRWATLLVGTAEGGVKTPEALSVTALLHVGERPDRVGWAMQLLRPQITLFLDEASWSASGLTVEPFPFAIPDPHRAGVTYEGWWGRRPDGAIVGKAPQHPAAHSLYRAADIHLYLQAASAMAENN